MPRGGRGRARAGRGRRKLSAVRRNDAEEDPLEDDDESTPAVSTQKQETAQPRTATVSPSEAMAAPGPLLQLGAASTATAAAVAPTRPGTFAAIAGLPLLAEQPLDERERRLIKHYRDIQKFLKNSPFYVRPPRQSEHADLARYSDQYLPNAPKEKRAMQMVDIVATAAQAFPAELVARRLPKRRRRGNRSGAAVGAGSPRATAASPHSVAGKHLSPRTVAALNGENGSPRRDDVSSEEEEEEGAASAAVAGEDESDMEDNEYTRIHADMEGEDSDAEAASDTEAGHF